MGVSAGSPSQTGSPSTESALGLGVSRSVGKPCRAVTAGRLCQPSDVGAARRPSHAGRIRYAPKASRRRPVVALLHSSWRGQPHGIVARGGPVVLAIGGRSPPVYARAAAKGSG